MSPFKILVISAAGLAVAGVATVLTVGYVNSPTQPEAAKAPTPAPAAPPALSAAEVKVAYEECVQKMFPTTADAGQRSAACSKALGSRQLQPTEVAMARLTRPLPSWNGWMVTNQKWAMPARNTGSVPSGVSNHRRKWSTSPGIRPAAGASGRHPGWAVLPAR